MTTVNVTQEEYEAMMFYRDETMDKAQSTSNEEYLADYDRYSDAFEKFREKYHKAKIQEDARKLVKKALKNAESKMPK